MTYRIGPKGQVVIPKPIRDDLGLEPGDEVEFERRQEAIVLRVVRSQEPLRGRFRGMRLSDDLLAQRGDDRVREEAR